MYIYSNALYKYMYVIYPGCKTAMNLFCVLLGLFKRPSPIKTSLTRTCMHLLTCMPFVSGMSTKACKIELHVSAKLITTSVFQVEFSRDLMYRYPQALQNDVGF